MYLFFRIVGRSDDSVALAKQLVAEAGLGLAPGAAFWAGRRGLSALVLCSVGCAAGARRGATGVVSEELKAAEAPFKRCTSKTLPGSYAPVEADSGSSGCLRQGDHYVEKIIAGRTDRARHAGGGSLRRRFLHHRWLPSHREAPFITSVPKVDGTDFYMFRSYESGRDAFVTMVANYIPLQDAYGGPNYFSLDTNALYEIHIDNNGNGVEDITFQFRFQNNLADITLPIGGKNVSIPLVQAGVISASSNAALNLKETYQIVVVRGDRRSGQRQAVLGAGGVRDLVKPFDFIGTKTFGSVAGYEAYAHRAFHTITIPGCTTPGRGVRRPTQGSVRDRVGQGVRPAEPQPAGSSRRGRRSRRQERHKHRSRGRGSVFDGPAATR